MIRLFRHFDVKFFYFNIFTFIIIILLIFAKIWKVSLNRTLNGMIINFIETFFLRLNKFKFTKLRWFFFFLIFIMILILNIFSVFSYIFPFNSQINGVLLFSLSFWFSFNFFNFLKNRKGIMAHLIPEGSPIYLVVLLFLIELIRRIIRPITLTVRLTANILAGHLLIVLLSKLVLIFNFSFILLIVLNIIELAVRVIQSYIFSTLIVLYFLEVYDN